MPISPRRNPWTWIPSLYFAEGLPLVLVMSVSVVFYKKMGISNDLIAFYTSWLYLPWVVKPIWSPFVDLRGRKRTWILATQLLVGAGLAGVGLTIPLPGFFAWTLVIFWLLAFASATHDIAADGFYMLGLSDHHQALFVGIRSTFYRLAMIAGQGLLVILAGVLEAATDGDVPLAWSVTFLVAAGIFLLVAVYHRFALPRPEADAPATEGEALLAGFWRTFVLFFRKKGIGLVLAFLLLYRLGEAQLVKLAQPFLLDGRDVGGLGFSTTEVGFVYGTVGLVALTTGGIIGGVAASRRGLRACLFGMVIAINLPNAVYIWLAWAQPESFLAVNACVAIEQLGYGYGFTAYMLYMIYVSRGSHRTAHFAITTGVMAAGMMIPGMFSGFIQEMLGYRHFFVWVLASTIPAFVIVRLVEIEPEFGKRETTA